MAFSFWVTAAVLLLVYAWTLTETVPLTVEVGDGACKAVLGERWSEIPCPELDGGAVGVYLTHTSPASILIFRPLDLPAPRAAWERVVIRTSKETIQLLPGRPIEAGTGSVYGKAIIWPAPRPSDFTVEARVRRPDGEHAGILLLKPDRENGLAFIIDSKTRQGSWWRWQDGRPWEPIAGVPYQKPLLAQSQSLLRQVLATFLGTLGIVIAVWGVSWIWGRSGRSLAPFSAAPPAKKKRIRRASLIVIILAIFGITAWLAIDPLERMPHVQDSLTFLFQAQTFAGGALWAPEPPLQAAFDQEFLIAWRGKWFGQYAPGYPALLAIGVLLELPWLLNPWLAALTAALLFTLGKQLYRPSTGSLAALLAAFSPFFLILSGSLMAHTAELFWTTLAMVSWAAALQRPYRPRMALLAGGALSMLLLTRQITAVAIGVSFVALMLAAEWRPQRSTLVQAVRQGLAKQMIGSLAVMMIFVLLLLGYQAALTGSPWQDPRLLGRPFDQPGFGQDTGEKENVFKLELMAEGLAVTWYNDPRQPPRGHTLARGLYNTERNWGALADHLFGWYPLFALAFCWMPFLFGRPNKYDRILLATLLVVIGVYVTYWTTGLMYGPRYYYAALPAFLLLTARGLQTLGKRFGTMGTVVVFVGLAGIALLMYWPNALEGLRGYNHIDGKDQSQVEAQISEPALVFVPVSDWWDYGRFFSANTPWLDGHIIYARDLSAKENDCLRAHYPGRSAYLWQPGTKSLATITEHTNDCQILDFIHFKSNNRQYR